ncbi:MAG: XRE family transcriptional regulator [Thermodesulfobacteriota bacterium]
MIEQKIALKIKEIREARGLTLANLGEKTGLSKALLSRIENNRSSPPIATLSRIAQGLGVPLTIFFNEHEQEIPKYVLTKKNERKPVVRRAGNIGFIYYLLSGLKGPHLIDAFIVHHPPASQKTAKPLFDHPGEELLFILRGEVEFTYGKEKIRLSAGDALHFDPSFPHRAQNAGEVETECLVVVVAKGTM